MQNKAAKTGWVRWTRLISGWLLIVAGLAGFVLPIIPGIPLLLGGLALLAPEYVWAKRAMTWVKDWVKRMRQKKDSSATPAGLPARPPADRETN